MATLYLARLMNEKSAVLIKDDSIKWIVNHLADKFGGDKFSIKDYWEGDLAAIGLIDLSENYLIYISTYGRDIHDFYVALENPANVESEHPYEPAEEYEHVDLKQLEDLFSKHLRICRIE